MLQFARRTRRSVQARRTPYLINRKLMGYR